MTHNASAPSRDCFRLGAFDKKKTALDRFCNDAA